MNSTPATLLERLRREPDEEAWERFVELYTPLLLAWARRIGLTPPEDADFVQEVFAHLVTKLPGFVYDSKRSFRGWLRTVAHNLWRNRRERGVPVAGGVDLNELAAPEAEAFWESEYRRQVVDRALAIMRSDFQPTTWRACWETAVNGLSAEEAAGLLGISADAVRAAKYRVLSRLRRELDGLLD